MIIKCVLLILCLSFYNGNCDRIKDKMYSYLVSEAACYRRLNGTHQTGCSSKWGGSTGVVHFCKTYADLKFILKNGTAGPYIPIIPVDMLNPDTINRLKSSEKVSGLVLYMNNATLDHFTHDSQCPNQDYGLPNTCGDNKPVWNRYGTGLLYENIPFPIFYTDIYTDVMEMEKCFEKFNNFSYNTQRDRALCSLHMKSFMFATQNTPTCIRRSNLVTNLNPIRVCDPLGDENIWASLSPLNKEEENGVVKSSYIVVSSRIDTVSMFDTTWGADSPVTGLVTLLAVAKLLKLAQLPEKPSNGRKVLFLLLNGETFDYLGSQRLLYDMENEDFPSKKEDGTPLPVIKPENISLFIELSQLGASLGNLYVHRQELVNENQQFVKYLDQYKNGMNLELSNGTLPPSSVHTFAKKYPQFPAVVLTDHKDEYTNRFYNSIFDNSSNIGYNYSGSKGDGIEKHLTDVAVMVAKSIFLKIKGLEYNVTEEIYAEIYKLVDELLYCYLENPNCKVYQAVHKAKFQDSPLNLYVGVDRNSNLVTTLTGLILGWLTGDIVGDSNENCTNIRKNQGFRYYNMSKDLTDLNVTKCFRLSMNFTEAVSPAFIKEDYDWSSKEFSSWSESIWGDTNMRLFLKPSAAHENMTIAIGSMTLIFSFIVVYFVKSRSDILFSGQVNEPAPVLC